MSGVRFVPGTRPGRCKGNFAGCVKEIPPGAGPGCSAFDARDLVQVKYEMVRRVRVEGQPVSRSATAFGFSRPSFYKARAAFAQGGTPALVPKRPGQRRAHKLSDEVMDFLERSLSDDSSLRPRELARRIEKRFGFSSHPRSIERALARREKKRQ